MSLEFITELAQPKAIDLRVRNAIVDGTATFNGPTTYTGDVTIDGKLTVDGDIDGGGQIKNVSSFPAVFITNNGSNTNRASLILNGNSVAPVGNTQVQSDQSGNASLQNFQSTGTLVILTNNGAISINPGTSSTTIHNPILVPPASAAYTPTVSFGGTNQALSAAGGHVSQIGNVVFYNFFFRINGSVTGTGNSLVSNWPPASVTAPSTGDSLPACCETTNVLAPTAKSVNVFFDANTGSFNEVNYTDGTTATLTDSTTGAGAFFSVSGSYISQ